MLGNILYGGGMYGGKNLGIYVAEVAANLSNSNTGTLIRNVAVFSSWHTVVRNADLDVELNFTDDERITPKQVAIGAYGNFDDFGGELLVRMVVANSARFLPTTIVARGLAPVGIGAFHEFSLEHPGMNLIRWSKIGTLDFTFDKSNVAGEAPIDIQGYVHAIERLGTSNVFLVYLSDGIAKLQASGVMFGNIPIYRGGVKNKQAIVNTRFGHFFVNRNSELMFVTLDGQINKLGYKEQLELMDYVVMSYNPRDGLIHLCDGVYGFVYSLEENCFVSGPNNITGIGFHSGELFVQSSGEIPVLTRAIKTDRYDFGTRKNKTISRIQVNANILNGLSMSIDFKNIVGEDFSTTPVVAVNPNGLVELPCHGLEFRFNLFPERPGFILEDLTVFGSIHGMEYLDISSGRHA